MLGDTANPNICARNEQTKSKVMTIKHLIDHINSVADECREAGKLDPFYNYAASAIAEFAETLNNKSNSQLNNDILILHLKNSKT